MGPCGGHQRYFISMGSNPPAGIQAGATAAPGMDPMKRALALCALMLAPLSFAHEPAGAPNLRCEDPSEWGTHDWTLMPYEATDRALASTAVLHERSGNPPSKSMAPYLDGSAEGCGAGLLGDDGHHESGTGGALLVAESGDGVSGGGLACWGEAGHHGRQVSVSDVVLGSEVSFRVVVDHSGTSLPEERCGDGVVQPCWPPSIGDPPYPIYIIVDLVNALIYAIFSDEGSTCNPLDREALCLATCSVGFPPGQDGAYHVIVSPTPGGLPVGLPTGATQGHVWTS